MRFPHHWYTQSMDQVCIVMQHFVFSLEEQWERKEIFFKPVTFWNTDIRVICRSELQKITGWISHFETNFAFFRLSSLMSLVTLFTASNQVLSVINSCLQIIDWHPNKCFKDYYFSCSALQQGTTAGCWNCMQWTLKRKDRRRPLLCQELAKVSVSTKKHEVVKKQSGLPNAWNTLIMFTREVRLYSAYLSWTELLSFLSWAFS